MTCERTQVRFQDRINRNILECKDLRIRFRVIRFRVLIETYWNVKYFTDVPWPDFKRVLIETYWNVKIITQEYIINTVAEY